MQSRKVKFRLGQCPPHNFSSGDMNVLRGDKKKLPKTVA